MLIPNSEIYNDQGDLSHFGIVDPVTGEPALIPHYNDNYSAFGGDPSLRTTGGNGAQELQANAAGGGGGASDNSYQGNLLGGVATGIANGASAIGSGIANMSQGGSFSGSPVASVTPSAAPIQAGGGLPPAQDASLPTGAAPNIPGAQSGAMYTGPGGATMTPALGSGIMKTTRDNGSENKVDAGALSDFHKQNELGAQATEEAQKAVVAESKVRQMQADMSATAIAEHQQAADAARATYQAAVEKKQQEIQADTDKFTNTPIDANHFWADKGTGDKVMAGIAIALGALGGALSGTNGNVGLDIINKAIDRDLKTQELNMQKSGQAITMKRGLLSDYMSQYGDMEKAKEASAIAYQKGVAQHFESMAMAAKDPGTQALGMKQAAAIRADADAKTMELTKKTVGWETTTAPMTKSAGPLGPKETLELSNQEASMNEIQKLKETVSNNRDKFGKVAGSMGHVAAAVGLPQDASQKEVEAALEPTLVRAYTSLNNGVYTEGINKLVDKAKTSIMSNPANLEATLDSVQNQLKSFNDSQRGSYGSQGYTMPASQHRMTTQQMNDQLTRVPSKK